MNLHKCLQCHRDFTAPDNSQTVRCPYCGNVQTASNSTAANSQQAYGQQQPYGSQQPYGQQSYGPQYAYGSQPTPDIGVFDVGPSGKSRGVAGLLALLIGWLGVHYFYCGKVGGGFICILLCAVTCGLWSVLTFVQGILMMCMRSDEFERKYVNTPSTFPLF